MNKLIILSVALSFIGCGKEVIRGPAGVQGEQGIKGDSGTSCTVTSVAAGQPGAPNGGSLISCQDGTSSLILNGAQGVQGNAGTNGTNGTLVSMVQFCPGVTTSYPSVFPEFGVCLDNSIYAVYWDNHNAWLSEIVKGSYISTSTSAPCSFSVGDNCSIIQN